jgi:succinate-semialdehyde dehydrogenase/glutarate-semialdehyde dehydrogenase
MGSLSSTIVCADANIEAAIPRIVGAAFRKAGQVCTSVQRLYVERPVADEVVATLVEALSQKKAGDPSSPDTFVGPLISSSEASRVSSWIDEARSHGAKLLAGGLVTATCSHQPY